MEQEKILAAAKLYFQNNPQLLLLEGRLTIKSKTQQLIKLKLNSLQKIVLNKINEIKKAGKPVRLWILKARQGGISTLIQGIFYAITSQREGINSTVISHDLDSSNYLFEMQKLFHEKLPVYLKPQIKHSNEKKLEFAQLHSQILIDTAENKKAGRAFTFQLVHLSEAAYFRNLRELLLGLAQSVPNAPETMIIGETTANGLGGELYEEWLRAKDGKSDWRILFIAWFEIPEYSLPLEDGKFYPLEGIRNIEIEKFLEEEKELKEKFNLTNEQLNWRRWCIVNNCNGEVLGFRQEYPATDLEAFVAKGDIFLDRVALARQKEKVPEIGNLVKYEGKYVFRPHPEGKFKIYEHPEIMGQYCIGADSAEGLPHGDKSAAEVGNKLTNETVAAYNCHSSPDEFSQDLIALGSYYNNALIAPENKGYGYTVCQNLWNWGYGNVYRSLKTKKGYTETSDELGWNTNSVTRPIMLVQFYEEIKNVACILNDKELIRQCWCFIKNPDKDGKPMAVQGDCDDLVMARCIRGQVMTYYPYHPKNRVRSSGNNWQGKYTRYRTRRKDHKYSPEYEARLAYALR